MSAIAKTESLERLSVQTDMLEPNPGNPNKMGAREFDLLVDNLEKTGLTDPILVRPIANGKYRIVGGHHRWEAAKYLGFAEVPVTVITDPGFDEEAEDMQLLRHNTIRGKIDPQKFVALYYKHAGKYPEEVVQEMMGFADEAEFQRLIKQTAASLPKELKKKFEEAAKEVKTIDGLAKLLNTMFTKYGNTIPYGYMVLDYGGQQSLWVRVEKKTMDALEITAEICIEKKRTMDDILGKIVQLIAKGDLEDLVSQIVEATPEVVIPENMPIAPTKDNIQKVMSVG